VSLGGAKRLRLAPENGSRGAEGGHRRRSPASGLSSVLCHLSSARAFKGLPPLGLLEPGARLGLGVGELDEKGIW
jgi:hypothetical protein